MVIAFGAELPRHARRWSSTSTRRRTIRSSARSSSRRRTTCCGSSCTSSSSTTSGPSTTRVRRASSIRSSASARPTTRRCVEDVRRSILMKAEEIGELRTQTLTENRETLLAAAEALRGAGRVLALGNGGSATDATDLVADLQRAGRAGDRPHRRSGDPDRDRQRRRRRGDLRPPGDRVRAARRRAGRALDQRRLGQRDRGAGRGAPARAGDDRPGRLRRRPDRRRAAGRPRRDHALAAHPAHPGGAGERLPRPLRAGGARERGAPRRVPRHGRRDGDDRPARVRARTRG